MSDKEDDKHKETALKYACLMFAKTRLSMDEEKITKIACRFLKFLKEGE